MRIAIDARELTASQAGGFRSYVAGLLAGLRAVDSVNEYVIVVSDRAGLKQQPVPLKSRIVEARGHRLMADHSVVRRVLREARPDVIHFPCNYGLSNLGVPSVITILDCICLRPSVVPSSLKARLLARYSAWMTKRSVPRADAIITISDYSRGEILHFFNLTSPVVITQLAANAFESETEAQPSDRIREWVGEPYFLLLASIDPRKNVMMALEAFSRSVASSHGCRLALVCSHPNAAEVVERKVAEIGLGGRAVVLTKISDLELSVLYRHAIALLFPSIDEGFGLPPLEAMMYGCPVISSNSSAMPEVLGDAAVYFDPMDRDALSRAIDEVWQSPERRESLRKQGIEQAGRYSWTKTAEKTLEVYQLALKRHEGSCSQCGKGSGQCR